MLDPPSDRILEPTLPSAQLERETGHDDVDHGAGGDGWLIAGRAPLRRSPQVGVSSRACADDGSLKSGYTDARWSCLFKR